MPNDTQRIQRALEVWRLTGKPLSALQGRERPELPFDLKGFALHVGDRESLGRRIEARFDAMLRDGLLDEVRSLRKKFDLTEAAPSMRAVGYRQAWDYLEKKLSKDEMRMQAIAATRQLAKRQLTWLRSPGREFAGLFRLDAGGGEGAPVAFQLLLDEIGKALGR